VLTGLPKRRHLVEHPQVESAAATRRAAPFALLMVDVDHFEKLSDEWGHDCGDAVLRIVAARLVLACRAGDRAGRGVGEESVAVAPVSMLAESSALADWVRAFVAESPIPVGASGSIIVTLSGGVFAGNDDVVELLGRADEAVYEAKPTGHDRVVAAELVA